MSAIAEFRTAVLALLDDPDLDRYTNDTVDAALAWALGAYSRVRPVMRTFSLEGAGTWRLELPAGFAARYITAITMDDGSDPPTEVDFRAFYYDESWFIETLDRLLGSGDTITVTYNAPQTIDGLEDAAGTTLPAEDEWIVQVGAAGHAARMRAVSRAESINMQPEVRRQLQEIAAAYLADFREALRPAPEAAVIALPDIEAEA